jgi:hypothetical protein
VIRMCKLLAAVVVAVSAVVGSLAVFARPASADPAIGRLVGVGCIGSDCYLVYENANGSLVWIPIA